MAGELVVYYTVSSLYPYSYAILAEALALALAAGVGCRSMCRQRGGGRYLSSGGPTGSPGHDTTWRVAVPSAGLARQVSPTKNGDRSSPDARTLLSDSEGEFVNGRSAASFNVVTTEHNWRTIQSRVGTCTCTPTPPPPPQRSLTRLAEPAPPSQRRSHYA